MNFFSVALASLAVLSGSLFADEEKTTATPNPAEAGSPSHWNSTSWDTPKGAKFWKAPAAPKTDPKPAKAPLSQPPQPNDFYDRQSEK